MVKQSVLSMTVCPQSFHIPLFLSAAVPTGDQGDQRALLQAAMSVAKAGNTADAVKMLMSALERFPRNVRMLTSAAVLEGRRGKVAEARALFNRGHLIEPSNAVLLRVYSLPDDSKTLAGGPKLRNQHE